MGVSLVAGCVSPLVEKVKFYIIKIIKSCLLFDEDYFYFTWPTLKINRITLHVLQQL